MTAAAYTHRQAGTQASLVQFSWPPFEAASRRSEEHGGARRWSHPSSHWVESESLESRLACVGVGVQLWWAAGGQWRVCVLRRRFSRDCRKERRALSSSNGEEPSSSTSAISAKVTGCVLNRASRGRRERLLPLAGPFGTGSCWGNSSMAEAIRWAGRTWKPEASITIWRTAAIGGTGAQICKKSNLILLPAHVSNFFSVLALSGALSYLQRSRCFGSNKAKSPSKKSRQTILQTSKSSHTEDYK